MADQGMINPDKYPPGLGPTSQGYAVYCTPGSFSYVVNNASAGYPGKNYIFRGVRSTYNGAIELGKTCIKSNNPPPGQGGDTTAPGDSPVGGAPCPPGWHPAESAGDSTANTPDSTAGGGVPCVKDEEQPPSPSKGECCANIDRAGETIAAALKEINATLLDKLGSGKKSVDDSFDELLDKLREKFEKGEKSCDECKQMLRNGMGGTIEYAIQCAGACIDKAACECSLGNPECWGEPCEGCGEPCCKCKEGICEPTDCPPEEQPKKYIGWCSPQTGSVIVTSEGAGPPAPGMYQVSLAASEQAAMQQGIANCGTQQYPGLPSTGLEPRKPINVPDALCNFNEFISGRGAERINSTNASANMAAGIAEMSNRILNIGIENINLGTPVGIADGVLRAFTGAPGMWFESLAPTAIAAIGCRDQTVQNGMNLLASIATISKQCGFDFGKYTKQFEYVINARCRQEFMNPDQALAAYLANAIDYRKLDGHWAIGNICNESLNSVLDASKAKPIPLQLAMMRRRKLIDASGYRDGMRRLGYLEPAVTEQLFQLTEQVPTLADITRLMVRDADDESITHWAESDRIFRQKYGGNLKKWAEFQGIPEEFAKLYFRAHWTIPAPGQLFTFYQRLRDNPKFGGRAKLLADIKAALVQQDILPFWQEHFLEVSFRPLSRVDIRRMFNIGELTEEEVNAAYRQLGSSDENATKLTKFAVRLRDDAAAGHRAIKLWLKFGIDRSEAKRRMVANGLPESVVDTALSDAQMAFASSLPAAAFVRGDLTRGQFTDRLETVGVETGAAGKLADLLALKITHHPALKGVALGVLEPTDAKARMINSGMAEQVVDNLLSEITETVDYEFAAACQKGIKRRYLMGEFDQQDAVAKLLATGLTNARANRLAESWNCEKSAVGKAVPTAKLCNWLGDGVISSLEFATRLEKLGHTAIDAARIRDDCLANISVKRQKIAEKEAKDQVALERREQAAIRRQESYAYQQALKQSRLQQSATTARDNREKQLLSAIAKAGKKCDCGLYDITQVVKQNHQRLQNEFGLTVDQSLQTLIKAAEAWAGGELSTYSDTVTTLALGLTESLEPANN